MNSNTNPQQQSRLQLWLEVDDDDGAAVDDDEGDDALSSEDPRSSPDVVFSKVPSLDLIWGGVSLFLRSCVSQISTPSAPGESI